MFFSPLEQFLILPLFNIFSIVHISNLFLTFLIIVGSFIGLFILMSKPKTRDLYLIPHNYQLIFENLFIAVQSIIADNIQMSNKSQFFPFICAVFFFVLNVNVFGTIPYTFTITSSLLITVLLSLNVFTFLQLKAINKFGIEMFSIFFPSGISVVLSFLLVPIELISYIFKPISMSVRLFSNMMAGHTLLKVIAGFCWLLMGSSGIFSIFFYVPFLILVILCFLETGVAIIQSFVITVLLAIYINDSLEPQH